MHVKPGMPLGTFLQTIHLRTNLPEGVPLEFTVSGVVVSDVSLLGGNYSASRRLLSLGTVQRSTGTKSMMRAVIKGPYHNDVKLTLKSVEPENGLHVTIGDPSPLGEGATMFPISVEIPPGTEPMNRLGGDKQGDYGKILIETTHPDAKLLRVMVRFAVAE